MATTSHILGMKRDLSIVRNVVRNLMIYIHLLIVLVTKVGIMNLMQGMKQEHFIVENVDNRLTTYIRLLTVPVVKAAIMSPLNKIYKYA